MRVIFIAFFSVLLVTPALAQNAAPVQQETQTHVTPGQKAAATSQAQQAATTQSLGTGAPQNRPIVLDSVVAIINGDVLLESDVEQERRFESLQLLSAAENTDIRAAERLITRTLILQQMKAQNQAPPNITSADTDKFIAELKKQLPGCVAARCQTDTGWASYLKERGMTPSEVVMRWRQRLIILDYLNQRFRTGVRIPTDQVQAYYDKTLVPQFAAKHEKPPTVKTLRPRIEEILLQEQVTKQIDDWEATLRQEGSVQILVPTYGKSSGNEESNAPESGPESGPGGGA